MPDFEQLRGALRENGIENSQQLCQQILKDTGVAVLPGSAFGFADNYLVVRLAFVDFDGQSILDAIEQYGDSIIDQDDFIEKYANKVYDGMIKLSKWASVREVVTN